MLKRIWTFVALILAAGYTYADPIINTFNAYPVASNRQMVVSATAATTEEFTVTISRSLNPVTGSLEGVLMNMNIVLRGGGVAEETLTPAVLVQTSDFNGGMYATKIFSVNIPANKQGRQVFLKYTFTQAQTGQNVGPLYSSTYFSTVLTPTNPPTNPPTGPDTRIRLVPDQKSYTQMYPENNSYVYLPPNTVMIGRFHTGDENGSTNYLYATLKAIDTAGNTVPGTITVSEGTWTGEFNEKGSFYVAPANNLLTGRIHVGDENQKSRMRYSNVTFNGRSTSIPQGPENGAKTISLPKESQTGNWVSQIPPNMVIYGRKHLGDENGQTDYFFSTIYVNP